MRLIRPSYEIIEQQPGIQGVYDIIERCGKTSYKSETKGGEVAKRFVDSRAREHHGAVLEFGTVYLKIRVGSPVYDEYYMEETRDVGFYKRNKYSKVVKCQETVEADGKKFGITAYYITTNYRVLADNNRLGDIEAYGCDAPEEKHERRYCVKFITDIGVGREFLRHRVMSMVQESTRYVNYSKEKFGEECAFILPPWIHSDDVAEGKNIHWWDGDWVDMDSMEVIHYGPSDNKNRKTDMWLRAMENADENYRVLINCGWTPQQARGVLPLATKTEFVLCGFKDAWIHFFRLRSDIAVTGKPHPQAEELANPLRDEFVERGYLSKEDLEKDVFSQFDVCISDQDLK